MPHVFQTIDFPKTVQRLSKACERKTLRLHTQMSALAKIRTAENLRQEKRRNEAERLVKDVAKMLKVEPVYHAFWRFQFTAWAGPERAGYKGRRATATGGTTKTETESMALAVQSEQNAIRNAWKDAPKPSSIRRPFNELIAEFIASGKSNGGSGGRAWTAEHLRHRVMQLDFWKARLQRP